MKHFLTMSVAQRQMVFAGQKRLVDLPEVSIEKDLWVTQVLHALFSLPISTHLIFKGGTSLSKAWKLIDRFSEDIDFAIDPQLFGVPEGFPTKKQIKKLRKAASLYVAEDLAEMLRARFAEMGLAEWLSVEAQPNGEGDNTYPEPRQLYVHYNSVYQGQKGYLRSDIILEVSARSLLEPVSEAEIHSILSESIPVKDIAPIPVITAVAGKTMVEKMFLLHEMFSVDGYGLKVERKSRHLYDLYMMMGHDFAAKAIADDVLWESIRQHRAVFTAVSGVDYSSDIRGHLVLVPRDDIREIWRRDYEQMRNVMIYGEKPSWDELIAAMQSLQERVREQ